MNQEEEELKNAIKNCGIIFLLSFVLVLFSFLFNLFFCMWYVELYNQPHPFNFWDPVIPWIPRLVQFICYTVQFLIIYYWALRNLRILELHYIGDEIHYSRLRTLYPFVMLSTASTSIYFINGTLGMLSWGILPFLLGLVVILVVGLFTYYIYCLGKVTERKFLKVASVFFIPAPIIASFDIFNVVEFFTRSMSEQVKSAIESSLIIFSAIGHLIVALAFIHWYFHHN